MSDLFAGPSGLGESVSSLVDRDGHRSFTLRVSIEKDEVAHRTLLLRALFRAFEEDHVPDSYYDYRQGNIFRSVLFAHPSVSDEARYAASEAKCAELGKTPVAEVDAWISSALDGTGEWALIGGPPCQAYGPHNPGGASWWAPTTRRPLPGAAFSLARSADCKLASQVSTSSMSTIAAY
ncbi:MAG: hypothetical protein ABI351_12405 [Herbaspirillum sp.]